MLAEESTGSQPPNHQLSPELIMRLIGGLAAGAAQAKPAARARGQGSNHERTYFFPTRSVSSVFQVTRVQMAR